MTGHSGTTRKGQKSLEMIIGLVILLVVAAVVISMFLNIFQQPKIGQQTVEKKKIKQACSNACNQWKNSKGRNALSAAVEYCTKKFVFDANDDGSTSQVAGNGFNSYCENGVHCFNIHTCSAGFQTLDYEKCRQLMCQYYTRINGDPYSLNVQDNVHSHIAEIFSPQNRKTGIGTCGLAKIEDSAGYKIATWYNQQAAEKDFYQGDSQQAGAGDNPGLICGSKYQGSGGGTWCQENGHGTQITGCTGATSAGQQMSTYCSNNNCPNPQTYTAPCSGSNALACAGSN